MSIVVVVTKIAVDWKILEKRVHRKNHQLLPLNFSLNKFFD